MEIKNSKDISKEVNLHRPDNPYRRILAKLKRQGTYYTTREVAYFFQISLPTLHKICKELEAPSCYYLWGRRYIWLYIPEDIEEIATAIGITLRSDWKVKEEDEIREELQRVQD